MTAIANPKKLMGSLIGIGAMIVVFGISYALASGEVVASYGELLKPPPEWLVRGYSLFIFYSY